MKIYKVTNFALTFIFESPSVPPEVSVTFSLDQLANLHSDTLPDLAPLPLCGEV